MSSLPSTSPVVQRLLASFPGSSGSAPLFPPSTPKSSRKPRVKKSSSSASNPTTKTEKRHSPTNKQCFASGSFSDSPSANSVPPPPITWVIEESVDLDQSGSESDVSCSTDSSSSSRDEMKTPVYAEAGFRVNPLQLIAAVSSA